MAVAGSGNKPVKPPLVSANVRLQTPDKPATPSVPVPDERERPSKGWGPKAGSAPGPTQTPAQQVRAAVDEAKGEAKASIAEIGRDSAAAIRAQPTDLLKLVKDGEVEMRLPLRPGTRLTGALELGGHEVGPHLRGAAVEVPTMMKVHGLVKDGKLIPSKTSVEFDPPLKGPLWSKIDRVTITDKGQAQVSLSGLPDPKVGPEQVSLDMKSIADTLEQVQHTGKSTSSLFGIKFGVDAPDASKAVELAGRVIDTGGSTVQLKNVSLAAGTLQVGSSGTLKLAPGGKVGISGSLDQLKLSGHVEIEDLNVNQDGVLLKGGRGSTDLDVTVKNALIDNRPQVSTSLTNLDMKVQYAATTRANGDYLEMADGRLKGGSIVLNEALSARPGSHAHLKVNDFEGQIKRARLTMADGSGTAQVGINGAHVKGSFDLSHGAISLDGQLTQLDATLSDYQGEVGKTSADVQTVNLKGNAHLALDSHQKKLVVDSDGQVDLAMKHVKVGSQGVSVNADDGRVTGTGTAHFDAGRGLSVTGDLHLSAALHDGKVDLPGVGSFTFKQGTSIEGALREVAFGPNGASVKLQNTRLDAVLSKGSLALPGGGTLDVKNAKVGFMFNALSGGTDGVPTASGSMTLEAAVGVKELKNLKLPSVTLGKVNNLNQTLEAKLGDFELKSNGDFAVSNMTYALRGEVDRFTGHLQLKDPAPQLRARPAKAAK